MRVLIVEDEASVRTFLCRAVACLMPGAQVVSEADGRQALVSFLASPADLVISDNRMPHMTGLDLLHALRERSAVPFIMVSAEPAFERRATLAGASACISKPLTLSDLRTAICSAMATPMNYTEPCAK
ncbi:MAG: response regulator [Oscillochloris sp.]|nr:response regulator [Oscillochloris sp.]